MLAVQHVMLGCYWLKKSIMTGWKPCHDSLLGVADTAGWGIRLGQHSCQAWQLLLFLLTGGGGGGLHGFCFLAGGGAEGSHGGM